MEQILDHVMIRVEDLDESLAWYQDHLGYEEKGRWEADTFTNVNLGPADAHEDEPYLELTYNHDDRSYEMGDAWGHIAVRVEDVDEAYHNLMEAGVEDYRDPDSCPGNYAFVKDPDGHELEIVQRDYGAATWGIEHVMLRTENVDAAIGWYLRKLGYEMIGRSENETFALYFMKPGGAPRETAPIELTYNYDGRSYEMGDAWGHIAVRTDDLHGFWDDLIEREAADYRDPESCGNRYAFTKDADDHEIEIVERS